MLVECGHVRATASDGSEFSFTPSFGRIAGLGSPDEIVTLYADLHGPKAVATATYILACLCDQEDVTPMLGWLDQDGRHPGAMPDPERIIIAQHLMRHGIIGKERPGAAGDGKFSSRFEAAEYISAARVHLGLSSADAEGLSMTEFQTMLEMKFPEVANGGAKDVPTREEYMAAMAMLKEQQRG